MSNVNFVMSVRPSACLSVRMEILSSRWTDFHEILNLGVLRKSVENVKVSLTTDNNSGYSA